MLILDTISPREHIHYTIIKSDLSTGNSATVCQHLFTSTPQQYATTLHFHRLLDSHAPRRSYPIPSPPLNHPSSLFPKMCTCFCETFCCFLLRWRDSLRHDGPDRSHPSTSSTSLTTFSPGRSYPPPYPHPHPHQGSLPSAAVTQPVVPQQSSYLVQPQQVYLPPQPMLSSPQSAPHPGGNP